MVEAYILLLVHSGHEFQVKADIDKLDFINSCRITFGEYDLVIHVTIPSVEKLGSIVSKNIRMIEGIKKTATLIVSDSLNNSSK